MAFKEHLRFVIAAVLRPRVFAKLTQPAAGRAFERLMADRPQYVSLLIAPYIDARWSSQVRVDRLIEHAAMLQGSLRRYDFSIDQSLQLLDLNQFAIPEFTVTLDKPMWFCHEGLITLNLIKDKFRFFSITFSFYAENSTVGIIIGGIQGRKTSDILQQYKEFTKLAHGLRPRDFLFKILQMIARAEGVESMIGIPDRYRFHRHSYFSANNRRDLHLDYDEIWTDRGGILTRDGMYRLPLKTDRSVAAISSRKRRMYRRRYELMDMIEARLAQTLRIAVPYDSTPLD